MRQQAAKVRFPGVTLTGIFSLTSKLRGNGRLTVVGALVLCMMIAAVASLLSDRYARGAITAGDARAQQISRTAAMQLELTLFSIDRALVRSGTEIAENWPASASSALRLTDFPDRTPVQLAFVDENGMMVETALGRLPQPIDVSDSMLLDDLARPSASGGRMYPPVISRISGRWSLPLTRQVRGLDGERLGVVVAMLDIETLGDVLHNVSLSDQDVIDIVAEDGGTWLRWPRTPATEGTIASDLDMSAFVARQTPVGGWPLAVRAGLSRAVLVGDTARVRTFIAVVSVAQILLIGFFAVMLLRRSDQLVAQRDAAAAVQRELAAMLDAVPADIMQLDDKGVLKRANARALKSTLGKHASLGLPLTDVLTQAYDSQPRLVAPAEREAWLAQQLEWLDKGGVFEERSRRGTWRRIHIEPMPAGGKLVLRLDITKSKQRQEQLDHIFDADGAFIVLLDGEQRVMLANRAFAAAIGVNQADCTGKGFNELGFGRIPSAAFADWRAAAPGSVRRPVEFDAEIRLDGKPHVARFTANPQSNVYGELSHIVLIGHDDTARRESEIRMFDSARLANLGEMATGIAHEVNQPLAIMRLAAESATEELEMVGEGSAASAETVEFVENKLKRISQQTERAANIIRDLRTVARKPANQAEPFDLADAVKVACNLIQEQLRLNRVEMKLDLASPGPMVHGESGRLQQVIMNLINNARDAILERTDDTQRAYAGHISVRVNLDGPDRAQVIVEDDGPGIPDSAMHRLFEPFFTTKPTGKGTGLGLSISYDIVRRMGGEIAAENRAEGGARFRIVFPVHVAAAATATQAA